MVNLEQAKISTDNVGGMMHSLRGGLAALVVGTVLVAGCSSQDDLGAVPPLSGSPPSISISGAYVQTQPGANPFVAFTLTSSQEDVVTGVSTANGAEVILTDKTPQPTQSLDPAVSKAPPVYEPGTPVTEVPVPAGLPVVFGPGGYGLFVGEKNLKPGKSVGLEVTLQDAGPVPLSAVVR